MSGAGYRSTTMNERPMSGRQQEPLKVSFRVFGVQTFNPSEAVTLSRQAQPKLVQKPRTCTAERLVPQVCCVNGSRVHLLAPGWRRCPLLRLLQRSRIPANGHRVLRRFRRLEALDDAGSDRILHIALAKARSPFLEDPGPSADLRRAVPSARRGQACLGGRLGRGVRIDGDVDVAICHLALHHVGRRGDRLL